MLYDLLKIRGEVLAKIREFFNERKILEVETPLLYPYSSTSPQLDSYSVAGGFLQTSPEFAMKRLLAHGSGSIYQVCKAFRKGECGAFHNPEFSMLEWYHLDFDHHQLMEEVLELLKLFYPEVAFEKIRYSALFQDFFQIDPLEVSLTTLKEIGTRYQLQFDFGKRQWLEALFSLVIEPNLPKEKLIFVYDFPEDQAMLARLNWDQKTAARFEVYFQGLELGNGFYELKNAKEQKARFEKDNAERLQLGLPIIPIDNSLLDDLAHLPDCAGVAMGLDRLLLLLHQAKNFDEILPFRQLL